MTQARRALLDHKDDIAALANQYQISRVFVFGSVARGTDDDTSDLDLLVDAPESVSLLAIGGFLMDVRDMLGIPVDVTSVRMLKARIRDKVLAEAVPI